MFISLAVKPDPPVAATAGCCACNLKPDAKNHKKRNVNLRDTLKRVMENCDNMI
jgi:hypothetical protein